MTHYNIKEIAKIIKAEKRDWLPNEISVLLTDSRSLTYPDVTLFFALVTPQGDGHKYIEDLYHKGVRNFVVSTPLPALEGLKDINLLRVKNTLIALQQLAVYHRRKFTIPIIGITGSNGKTTVKEWLNQLLWEDFRIVRSPRSYNSQTGVPLSVWQLDSRSELGIFEAGISQMGEMEKIAPIINPQIGIFTNIGNAHQEGFDSIQAKCEEKLALFSGSDILIYNGDDHIVSETISKTCLTVREIAWSRTNRNSPLYIYKIEKGEHNSTIHYSYLQHEASFIIPFTQDAAIENIIHCLAAMLYLGKSPDIIAQRMPLLEPLAMRLEVKEGINNTLIINDSYNADLDSLSIALDFLSRRVVASGVKKTLILSDILQSGMLSTSLYKRVADLVMRKNVDKIITIGRDISTIIPLLSIEKTHFSSTTDFLASDIIHNLNNEVVLIKGARKYHFERIVETLELKRHETILEVNLDALVANFNHYKSILKPETRMVCMVKAFGYGVGSHELAKTLQDHGCNYLAVAVADEGVELRNKGITIPIMVMNPEISSLRTLIDYNLEPEIYSFRILNAFLREAQKEGTAHFPIHIKIDSGMHRLGFEEKEMKALTEELSKQNCVTVRSVFSHLAGSDDPTFDRFTLQQIALFERCAQEIQKSAPFPILRHILNSAGISRFNDYQFEMVRLGIGLYGMPSYTGEMGLRPVSSLKTIILQIKSLAAGETVGYGRKGKINRTSRIAVIPIGYADGIDRKLGNGNGRVWINGQYAHTIGNICMDLCMIDVTDIDCKEGDEVEIFGENIPIDEIAQTLNTISYEISTSISNRVKRIYYRE